MGVKCSKTNRCKTAPFVVCLVISVTPLPAQQPFLSRKTAPPSSLFAVFLLFSLPFPSVSEAEAELHFLYRRGWRPVGPSVGAGGARNRMGGSWIGAGGLLGRIGGTRIGAGTARERGAGGPDTEPRDRQRRGPAPTQSVGARHRECRANTESVGLRHRDRRSSTLVCECRLLTTTACSFAFLLPFHV